MMFNDVANLIGQSSNGVNAIGDPVIEETSRRVFVKVSSIGLKRKLEAQEAGLKLEWKFTLSDVAEYNGEEIIEYKATRYNIVNAYITDAQRVDLIAARY